VRARTQDSNVVTIEHPLVAAKLAILRSKATLPEDFRRALQEISVLLLAEAARTWETVPYQIETPLRGCTVSNLKRPVVFVPILRAGLGMLDGMTTLLPDAAIGHIGVYRDEKTFLPAARDYRRSTGGAARSDAGDRKQRVPGSDLAKGEWG